MKRRTFLTACGMGALAGCLGGGGSTPGPEATQATEATDESIGTSTDAATTGEPTATLAPPTDHAVDPTTFETTKSDGVDVGLIPVVDAYQWHADGVARFVDARGETQYEKSHIAGAVSSPARMEPEPGPTADWSHDATIVAYCGCPHHLSAMRASQLKQAGFETVYAIDEGFWAWHDRGFPMEGTDIEDAPQSVEVSGSVDASLAGEEVWVVHEPTAQREVTTIDGDGSYTMHLHFYGVDADSTITLETPDSTRNVQLGELTDAL